jgi:hypothetical protein
MNLLLFIGILFILNLIGSIYLYKWFDNTLTEKKLTKKLNIFIVIILTSILIVNIIINYSFPFFDIFFYILGFILLRFSALFYFPFNILLTEKHNFIDNFNFDSILYWKLKRSEHGAMLKNIIAVWRWLLFGLTLYIFIDVV